MAAEGRRFSRAPSCGVIAFAIMGVPVEAFMAVFIGLPLVRRSRGWGWFRW
ncbi:MAG: hypothetical protein R2882_13220 [Gemmatimonadales bacterium]